MKVTNILKFNKSSEGNMAHVMDSNEVKQFFKNCGITIGSESAHNFLVLKNDATGEEVAIEAVSDAGIAAGIPGLYFTDIK